MNGWLLCAGLGCADVGSSTDSSDLHQKRWWGNLSAPLAAHGEHTVDQHESLILLGKQQLNKRRLSRNVLGAAGHPRNREAPHRIVVAHCLKCLE